MIITRVWLYSVSAEAPVEFSEPQRSIFCGCTRSYELIWGKKNSFVIRYGRINFSLSFSVVFDRCCLWHICYWRIVLSFLQKPVYYSTEKKRKQEKKTKGGNNLQISPSFYLTVHLRNIFILVYPTPSSFTWKFITMLPFSTRLCKWIVRGIGTLQIPRIIVHVSAYTACKARIRTTSIPSLFSCSLSPLRLLPSSFGLI